MIQTMKTNVQLFLYYFNIIFLFFITKKPIIFALASPVPEVLLYLF